MKNMLITIAMLGVMGYGFAQETTKTTKKAKSKPDTIVNRTTKTKVEKKSTYKTDSIKTKPAKKHKAKTTTIGRDSIPN
ncbi:hypothetical protein ASF10_11630 [Flavobacterium sp. Leaf82]|uniref:hypothetical protein n=1 Tax=unclassified Flavobacterium TaxID=196869 RepID=UPI0006FB5639|nr:hypothetical protein [Flavobacterium sp. Leaf82]KQO22986.1 hypothetical protein ASF10_11630 [Flavobacterium sp. Leaf82]